MAPSSRRAVALRCRPGTLHASLTRPTNLRVHRANRAGNDEEELGELDHAEYHLDEAAVSAHKDQVDLAKGQFSLNSA